MTLSSNYWLIPEQWLSEDDDNAILEQLEPEELYETQPDEMERL